jgi:hypothetical protein
MIDWFRRCPRASGDAHSSSVPGAPASAYVQEFMAAIDRTEAFGLSKPPRVLVAKDCVDMGRAMPVLLEYFDRHRPEELVGQTAAIHFALVPLLLDKTGIPFQLTIGWMVHDGRAIFQHDEETIRRFLRDKVAAWTSAGMPFHLWLTSPACEVLDVTFAMNVGWAKTRAQCEQLVVYQPAAAPPAKNIYHPMFVGPEFFSKTGAVL